jgi:hypothetical protein
MAAGIVAIALAALTLTSTLAFALATNQASARLRPRVAGSLLVAGSVHVAGSRRGATQKAHVGGGLVRFMVGHAAMTAQSGQTVAVRGRLLAAARGSGIRLLARQGGRWRLVGGSRTGQGGRFHILYTARAVGTTVLRVSVAARGAIRASASAGEIVVLRPAVASWYYDGGNTACGFHATYGIANRTLPCGAKVTISYGGHSVLATVDDRGPFVYGRSFDLNQNTAHVLGMNGVAQVLTSV